jgi:hypothetical protein
MGYRVRCGCGGERKVVGMNLRLIQSRLAERDVTIELETAAMDFILCEAYEPLYGARPIRRYLEKELVTKISRAIFAREIPNHSHVVMGYDQAGDRLILTAAPNANGSDTETKHGHSPGLVGYSQCYWCEDYAFYCKHSTCSQT